jgi:ferrous iron transport protein B
VVEGIIGGVGAVITFVPQMMILFFFLALMEDCGYMARVAFIMDRIFRKFGLSGKSFIPMLIGTGCTVPAIMASRTIENLRDRRMTIMLTPFIPCGAKLPVFALFVGVFFPNNTFVGPSMYLIGILAIIVSGILLKRTRLFAGDPAPFVMELPSYHMPRLKGVLIHMWDRGKAFIKKAGTIIAVASAGIWILQSTSWGFQMVEPDASILASLGRILAPVFRPLGFGFWEAAVATITGLLAKETIVATLGILVGVGEVTENDPNLILRISQLFTPLSAYAFMIFTLFAAPCAAAIGATRREMQSARWTWIAILFQTGIAYLAALLVFQIGSLFV